MSLKEGRTQAELADMAAVSQSAVSRWLKNKERPTAENAMNLARMAGDSPLVGLLAAGYLRDDEVDGVVRVSDQLSDRAAADLLSELGRRLGLHVSVRGEATG